MGKPDRLICECPHSRHAHYCTNAATKLCQVCGVKLCSTCGNRHHEHSQLVKLPAA